MKIVKSLKNSGLLIKDITQTIENDTKEQKVGFFSMLLCTLSTSLLGNMLTSKEVIQTGDGVNRAGQNFSSTSSFD